MLESWEILRTCKKMEETMWYSDYATQTDMIDKILELWPEYEFHCFLLIKLGQVHIIKYLGVIGYDYQSVMERNISTFHNILSEYIVDKTQFLNNCLSVFPNIENIKTINGRCMWHYYISDLRYCPDINVQDNNGDTPLHMGVAHKNYDPVQKLIDYGADPTIKNKYGQSALDYYLDGYKNVFNIGKALGL